MCSQRGEHEIENEMVFESNPGFVFHDSRGFEAGGKDEFDKVKAFITDRLTQAKIAKRLHVIWFCIPMDEACRSFTAGEEKFFTECDTASIPVMVLFTKFDALYGVEFRKLIKTGTSRKDAKQQAPKCAEETFALGPQLRFLQGVRWPPKCHVCLPNMNKDDADCSALIEQTAAALDDEALEQLFVSTQQTNLEICMKYAIQRTLPKHLKSTETTTSESHQKMIMMLSCWFPHLRLEELRRDFLRSSHCVEIQSNLLPVAPGLSPLDNVVQLISAVVIVFERSFYIHDKLRDPQNKPQSRPSFCVALDEYMRFPDKTTVSQGASDAVHAYKKAVVSAPKENAKVELIEAVLQIALNHRLPRP